MTGDFLVDDFLDRHVDSIADFLQDEEDNSAHAMRKRINKAFDDLAVAISRNTMRMSVMEQAFLDASDAMNLAWATIRQCQNPCSEEVLA